MHRHRAPRAIAAALTGLWLMIAAAASPPAVSPWLTTGSGTTYHLEASGDALGPDGARVALHSRDGDASKFGASAMVLDAAPLRGHTVRVAADLTVRGSVEGAALWLRADGETGSVAFVNSQQQPVTDGANDQPRELQIDVPQQAVRVLFGTILSGNGDATATHLRLSDLGAPIVPPGVTPQSVLDAAIGIVRANAWRSRDVDWPALERGVRALAQGARLPSDVHPAIRAMLFHLDDHHSRFVEPRQSAAWRAAGSPSRPPAVSSPRPGIGSVLMPGYDGSDDAAARAFATTVVDAIGAVAREAQCGWIVDLREDTGGNMWPMLAALKPLLGSDNLGSFELSFGRTRAWRAGDGVPASPAEGPDLSRSAVAVLIGPRTASSGEAVAIAFRGRPATRFFGTATAGLTSANRPFGLPDGSTIVLTTGIDLDRNDHAYGGKIDPDVIIDPRDGGDRDAASSAAIGWLEQGCGRREAGS